MAGLKRIGARPATRKVKVHCSDRDGCGWSGERKDPGRWDCVCDRPCPRCHQYSVELVGRTPNPTLELVALARARVAKET